ncbi:MAG: UDP-N-acetylmuramate--L-alanine ligase [Gemmatimonadaceae bacterium]
MHFAGIAGAGMSGLAQLFLRRGVAVTGCDSNPGSVSDLTRSGITVMTGHDPRHVESARALVVTSAMPLDHPEIARARELGIAVIRRAEALGEAVSAGKVVGIAGTHGKTTTTVMTTEALASAGLDPTGIAGGRVRAWQGNLRYGGHEVFVVEADEYDRSFLSLAPTIAVVTNVEADHLDIYSDLADIRRAFSQYLRGASTIVLCADDYGASTLQIPTSAEVIRYGVMSKSARLTVAARRTEGSRCVLEIDYDGERLGDVLLRVPGLHNVLNALAAVASGLALGATLEAMAPGLSGFTGVERRFQLLGVERGVTVIDDYAHHPTEIRATLEAARAAFPGRRVIAAFQPHLYTRTRDFANEFGVELSKADAVYLTEIYPAREQPIEGVTAELIEPAARAAGNEVRWRGERDALADELARGLSPGDVVLTMGAGDITRTGPELLDRLRAEDV